MSHEWIEEEVGAINLNQFRCTKCELIKFIFTDKRYKTEYHFRNIFWGFNELNCDETILRSILE